MEIAGENGWHILNGNKTGDEEGEYTYIGPKGATIIDYALANTRTWDRIQEMRVGVKTESDHQPLIVELWHRERERRTKDKEEKRLISIWDVEAINMYRKRLEACRVEETEVNEMWREVKKVVVNCMEKREVYGRKREEATWFDTECRRSKREVGRTYKKFRVRKIDREGYLAVREKHRELCTRKKEKRKEELIEEVKAIRSDTEAWKVINKYRKKRIKICNDIPKKKWKEYFMNLLAGKEQREVAKERRWKAEDGEPDQTEEEIEEQIRNLKVKKATREDQIPGEAWKYCTGQVKERIIEVMQKVWRGEGMSSDWDKGIIYPLHKKKKYRGGIKLQGYLAAKLGL